MAKPLPLPPLSERATKKIPLFFCSFPKPRGCWLDWANIMTTTGRIKDKDYRTISHLKPFSTCPPGAHIGRICVKRARARFAQDVPVLQTVAKLRCFPALFWLFVRPPRSTFFLQRALFFFALPYMYKLEHSLF